MTLIPLEKPVHTALLKTQRIAIVLAAATLAFAASTPVAMARHHGWHGGHHHGYSHERGRYGHHRTWHHHGHWRRYHSGWHHGRHYRAGTWIAGALVAGAVTGIVADASAPPVAYGPPPPPPPPPVAYGPYRQPTVIHERDAPEVVERRVYTSPRVYGGNESESDPHHTRFIRDDGWNGHGN